MENDPNFASLCRSYPAETAGKLEAYHYDEASHHFDMTFNANATGETKIFCSFIPKKVECNLPHTFQIENVSDKTCFCIIKADVSGEAAIVIE